MSYSELHSLIARLRAGAKGAVTLSGAQNLMAEAADTLEIFAPLKELANIFDRIAKHEAEMKRLLIESQSARLIVPTDTGSASGD